MTGCTLIHQDTFRTKIHPAGKVAHKPSSVGPSESKRSRTSRHHDRDWFIDGVSSKIWKKIMKSPPAQGAKFKRLCLSRGTKQKEAAIQVGKTQRMEGFEPLSFKALWDRKSGNFDSRSTPPCFCCSTLKTESDWMKENALFMICLLACLTNLLAGARNLRK